VISFLVLISSYFNIVKRTVIDMVPKAIMLKLVAHSKDDLQRELLSGMTAHLSSPLITLLSLRDTHLHT
jgi:hypothetical protein